MKDRNFGQKAGGWEICMAEIILSDLTRSVIRCELSMTTDRAKPSCLSEGFNRRLPGRVDLCGFSEIPRPLSACDSGHHIALVLEWHRCLQTIDVPWNRKGPVNPMWEFSQAASDPSVLKLNIRTLPEYQETLRIWAAVKSRLCNILMALPPSFCYTFGTVEVGIRRCIAFADSDGSQAVRSRLACLQFELEVH